MGHLQHDFDTGTRLSGICLYVTIALMRLQTLYPISLISLALNRLLVELLLEKVLSSVYFDKIARITNKINDPEG